MSNQFFKMPEKIFGISSSLIKLFFKPLGIVVVFIISLGVIIFPRIESIKTLSKSVGEIKLQIKSTEEKKAYLLSIDQEQLNRDADYLSSAVLPEKNSYLLVGVIRNIADKYGFSVDSFSLSINQIKTDSEEAIQVAKTDVAVKMPVNVVLSGPTEKSLDLIKGLENNLPILFIDSYKISSRSTVSELNLIVSSYYIPDKADLVSGNLTLSDLKPTKEEVILLEQISKFDKNQSLVKTSGSTEDEKFIEYNRDNPFSL